MSTLESIVEKVEDNASLSKYERKSKKLGKREEIYLYNNNNNNNNKILLAVSLYLFFFGLPCPVSVPYPTLVSVLHSPR